MNYMCMGSVDGSTDAPVKCDHAAETEVFRPCAQTGWGAAVLVAKTEGDPMLFASAIRSHVRSIDRDVTVTAVRTMDDGGGVAGSAAADDAAAGSVRRRGDAAG